MPGDLKLNAVSVPSTPAAGKHSIYVGSETLPRMRRVDEAGTVWPSADIFALSLAADYTLTSATGGQKCFDATTNGAITLPALSAYLLEAEYLISNTGTTSHTWGVLFAGTASLTALDFAARGRSGVTSQLTLTAESSASQSNGAGTLPTASLVVTAASTSSTENVLISIRGTLRVNGGGTFIPQIAMSAAPGGTSKMLRGSFIKLTPLGANTATNLGNWS